MGFVDPEGIGSQSTRITSENLWLPKMLFPSPPGLENGTERPVAQTFESTDDKVRLSKLKPIKVPPPPLLATPLLAALVQGHRHGDSSRECIDVRT